MAQSKPKKTVAAKSKVKKVMNKKTKTTTKKTSNSRDALLGDFFSLMSQNAKLWEKKQKDSDKLIKSLRSKLEKMSAKLKAAKDKRVQSAQKLKANPSAANKKRLAKDKEKYEEIAQMVQPLKQELADARAEHSQAKVNLTKLKGLNKVVATFEKKWMGTSKTTSTKKKAAPVAKAPVARKKKRSSPAKSKSKKASQAPEMKDAHDAMENINEHNEELALADA